MNDDTIIAIDKLDGDAAFLFALFIIIKQTICFQ